MLIAGVSYFKTKPMKIIGRTTKCIVCLKPGAYTTGHVKKGDMDVLARWCEEHHETVIKNFHTKENAYLLNSEGCFGGWHESYGFAKDKK